MLKIYDQYKINGVDKYYLENATKYYNPHQEKIESIFTKHIIKQEGLQGLYQGYTPTLLRQSLNQASRFLFYQHYKDYIQYLKNFNSQQFLLFINTNLSNNKYCYILLNFSMKLNFNLTIKLVFPITPCRHNII